MLAIGLMSGTSMDGIDVSLIRTDGESQLEIFANYHQPYDKDFQLELKQFASSQKQQQEYTNWSDLERRLTTLHAEAVNHLVEREKCHGKVEIVGFHGQTIVHDPSNGFTWQMGDPNLLARLVQIDVVGDFRRRDMAYGGQGAPLVPIYHRAITSKIDKPLVVVNIGGVTNFTYIGPNDKHEKDLIAFDVGPGNALIDDLCQEVFGVRYDDQGQLAAQGQVDRDLVADLLARDEYFNRSPPKSLDRNHFARVVSESGAGQRLAKLDKLDRLATLSYFTVASILKSIREHLPGNGL